MTSSFEEISLTAINRSRGWTLKRQRSVPAFPSFGELVARRSIAMQREGVIVAFYTTGGVYEIEKDRLLKSAELLGLRVDVMAVPSVGSWVRNAGLKPSILLDMRRKHRGQLLYLDVDAVLHRNPWPKLTCFSGDLAAYYAPTGRLLSGTLLVNDSQAAVSLLEKWKAACANDPALWDQLVLERIIAEDAAGAKPLFNIERLPVEFCWIFDRIDDESSPEIFIEHLQASREEKTKGRLFGRFSKALARRRERVLQIEQILFGKAQSANQPTLRTAGLETR